MASWQISRLVLTAVMVVSACAYQAGAPLAPDALPHFPTPLSRDDEHSPAPPREGAIPIATEIAPPPIPSTDIPAPGNPAVAPIGTSLPGPPIASGLLPPPPEAQITTPRNPAITAAGTFLSGPQTATEIPPLLPAEIAAPTDPPFTPVGASLSGPQTATEIPPLPPAVKIAAPTDPPFAPIGASLPGLQAAIEIPPLPPPAEIAVSVNFPFTPVETSLPGPGPRIEIPPLPPPAEIAVPANPPFAPIAIFQIPGPPTASSPLVPASPLATAPPAPAPAALGQSFGKDAAMPPSGEHPAQSADWITVANTLVEKLPTIVACLIAAGILFEGMRLFRQGKQPPGDARNWRDKLQDILQPHALQLIGLTFILPVILVAAALQLNSQAMTALLGAMIGYIFGVGGSQKPPNPLGQNDGSGGSDRTRTPPDSPEPSETNKQTGKGGGSAAEEAAKPETSGDDTTPGATGGGLDQTGSGEAGTPNPTTPGPEKPKE